MKWSPWEARNFFSQIHWHSNQGPNNVCLISSPWLAHCWWSQFSQSLLQKYFLSLRKLRKLYFLQVTMEKITGMPNSSKNSPNLKYFWAGSNLNKMWEIVNFMKNLLRIWTSLRIWMCMYNFIMTSQSHILRSYITLR